MTSTRTASSSSSSSTTTKNASHPDTLSASLTMDSIYQYYTQELFPALLASLPLLVKRLAVDAYHLLNRLLHYFILPSTDENATRTISYQSLPNEVVEWLQQQQDAMQEFLSKHQITVTPLWSLPDFLFRNHQQYRQHSNWWAFISREWPLMDWKIGVLLWRTFGGILLLLTILSIVPGRLHAWSAKVLRWPVLGLTYFLICVELAVYVVIRVVISTAEYIFCRPKHRALRRQMQQAVSYGEWYKAAATLDQSQKRDRWLKQVDDHTSYRYNWGFIKELMKDMKHARDVGDSLLALAVIQQCTRKNVGGVMSEDLFSYSNTGEPKYLVKEFVAEVVQTLDWITEEALKLPSTENHIPTRTEKETYETKLQTKVRVEKDKLWKSLVTATMNLLSSESKEENENDSNDVASSPSNNSLDSEHNNDTSDKLKPSGGSTNSFGSSKGGLPSFHREEVLNFVTRARAAFGRTALCLSGGAMMGLYHFGHVRALLEAGVLPHIISGTSAGSVVGAILCTRTDEELKRDLHPEVLAPRLLCFSRPWKERIKGIIQTGNMFDFDEWMEMIQWMTCGNMTFEEAYRKTGRVFCITLSSTTKKAPPVLLNYLSAPNVTIASAVIASAAVPGFVAPVRLQYKDSDGVIRKQTGDKEQTYYDGSIQQDIPVAGLAEMLNCQFFIACQCNPHVVPFFYNSKGKVGRPSRWSSGTQEDSWRGGFLLAALEMYLKNDMKAKFVFLNDLEAAVGFTSTLLTQEFVGSTTIVPQISFGDYFRLFSNPTIEELRRYMHVGAVAAYEHIAMIKLHYNIADALDDCVNRLETGKRRITMRPRTSFFVHDIVRHSDLEGMNAASTQFPVNALSMALKEKTTYQPDLFSLDPLDTDDDDDDEFERRWIDIDYS